MLAGVQSAAADEVPLAKRARSADERQNLFWRGNQVHFHSSPRGRRESVAPDSDRTFFWSGDGPRSGQQLTFPPLPQSQYRITFLFAGSAARSLRVWNQGSRRNWAVVKRMTAMRPDPQPCRILVV